MKNRHNTGFLREETVLGGGGGGEVTAPTIPDNWMEALPEDLRGEPSLKDYKPGLEGLSSAVKTMIHGQKMLGQPKVGIPKEGDQDSWDAYYNAGGRPETVDGYELKAPEDLKNVEFDDEKLAEWKKSFFELGLNNSQANALLAKYATTVDAQLTSEQGASAEQLNSLDQALRENWGGDYDSNLEIAKAAVRKFADDGFKEYLEQTGLGDDPRMIAFMHSVGQSFMSDRIAGTGEGLVISNQASAKNEIEQLKQDTDFITNLTDRNSPGHKAAKNRWSELHNIAFGSKSA